MHVRVIVSMHVTCNNIDPMKSGTWTLTREWALSWDTMVVVPYYNNINMHVVIACIIIL